MKKYKELEQLNSDYYTLEHIKEFLGHDRDAEMPVGASEFRGIQLGTLEKMQNRLMKNSDWKEIFEECRKDKTLNDNQRADVEETYRNWVNESCIPEDLLIDLANTTANSSRIWTDVKNGKATFKDILPHLEQIFKITEKIANEKGKYLKLSPYDCLIDNYQPGLKSEVIDPIFDDLKKFLPDLIKKCRDKNREIIEFKNYPKENKKNLVKNILALMGFDFERGRMSEVIHPHMAGLSPDVIVAVNYNSNPLDLIFTAMHEGGHAIYQQNLTDYLRAVGQQRGMAIHESQSLFFEMQIGNNENFIGALSKLMEKEFGNSPEFSEKNILANCRQVKPSLIRIEADEVTYPLHVIMRYEIERGIIENKIKVKDLPEIWNQKMQEYLDVTPPNDVTGCLQDCHWPMGLIGYFPSYTFGAIIAAQLMEKIRIDVPNMDDNLKNGKLSEIADWLNRSIHSRGCELSFEELIKNVTGKKLSTEAFKKHLMNRYKIY